MLVVGLTGGIGSGKSALARELALLGVPVIDADALSRDCVRPGSPVLAAIVARFGDGILSDDGELERSALASIVFSDAAARHDLEAITHPCIEARIHSELRALADSDEPPAVVVVEHPLLVESGAHELVDRIVAVEAPLERRIARLVAHRGMTSDEVMARIAAQVDDATRRVIADRIINNDGGLDELRVMAVRLRDALLTEGQGRV